MAGPCIIGRCMIGGAAPHLRSPSRHWLPRFPRRAGQARPERLVSRLSTFLWRPTAVWNVCIKLQKAPAHVGRQADITTHTCARLLPLLARHGGVADGNAYRVVSDLTPPWLAGSRASTAPSRPSGQGWRLRVASPPFWPAPVPIGTWSGCATNNSGGTHRLQSSAACSPQPASRSPQCHRTSYMRWRWRVRTADGGTLDRDTAKRRSCIVQQ